MKKENIAQYKADELPETTKTDWKRLDALTDEEIDTSEIPELDEEWFKNAKVVLPQKKKAISLRLDVDVLEWFKSNSKGRGYQTLMNAVLKAYVKAQKGRTHL
ncbi:MAG: BrnA antitoxin family protein [bacterium]